MADTLGGGFPLIGKDALHHRIVEKPGEDGMAVVYKVHGTHFDRFVAIKLIQPGKTADADHK